MRVALFGVLAFLLGGCATTQSEATPVIEISPRVAERLAQMNRFRRHDRPKARVTVEDVEEEGETEDGPQGSGGDTPTDRGETGP